MKFSPILLILTFCLTISAKTGFMIYHYNTLAWQGCSGILAKNVLLFSSKDKAGYCNVKNQPALGTMAHCIRMLPHHAEGAEQDFIKSCAKYHLTQEEFDHAYDNATQYLVLNPKKNDPNFNISKVFNKPVLLTQTQVNAGYDSNVGRYMNYNKSSFFALALLSYWFFLILLSGACNVVYFVCPGFIKKLTGKFNNSIRKLVFLPALGSKTHAHHKNLGKWIIWMLPTRWESIMMACYWILLILFSSLAYNHDKNNYIWPKESMEIGRKIADRTGSIVVFIIPQLILFAGRNNFMQWLSGWPYARFLYVHKWMSRASFLLIIAHAVGMTYNAGGFHAAKYHTRNSEAYVQWGYVALICSGLMFVQACYSIRKLNYEIFLILHLIFAVFFVAGGWIHVANHEFQQFFIAATAVWCFDRFVRLVRLAAFGIRSAQVQLIANETLKVTVARPRYWKPFPGCHAFIHFIRPTCFWQSHPFTIVDQVEDDKTHTITFYLKVKGGVTHGLYKYLSRQPENKATIKVTIEGPYGNRLPLDRYDTAVFLSGGNGIPGLYYQARDIVKNNSNKTRVKFYWVIRHYRSIEWFYEELLKFENSNVEPVVYVTQPDVGLTTPIAPQISSSSEFDEQEEKLNESNNTKAELHETESEAYIANLKKKLSFVDFREGRPNMNQVVAEEIAESNGSIAFTTCAHGTMVDDARKAVVDNLDSTPNRVELFEQIQGW
jgi:predicted ferric reductase